MKSGKAKALRWLIGGAVFLTVLMTSGCIMLGSHEQVVRDTAPATQPSFETAENRQPAPQIDVFGEFDGVQRSPTANGGEAGFQQHTFLDEGGDADVAVDPKGQWLVFSSTRDSEHANIYRQKIDGVSVTQLTNDNSDNAFPVFSPDGSKVAFCSTRNGNWDIFVMDSDGRDVVQVTSSPMQEIHPSFSPDGSRLAYSALSNRSGQWELWTVNLQTNEKRMIGFGLFPTWSPDKTKDVIAFQKARARGSRWFSLWTLDLKEGEARNITEVAVSANAAIVCPSWSPDGKKLTFSTIVAPAMTAANGRPQGQQDIWTVNVDGTNKHRVTDGNGASGTPYWAANNRIFFVSNRGGAECIWSAASDQTNTATANVDAGDGN